MHERVSTSQRPKYVRKVDLTGDYQTNIYTAARRLLAVGADPHDVIETSRDGMPSMTGAIGECAKWEVVDDRGLRLRKYLPRASTLGPLAPKSRFGAIRTKPA
jgi:hypothetical protein